MAASLSTLRANRVGGGLLSGAGVTSSLTITLNCRSRSARLRGAAGSAETRRLAVPSGVPFQASDGMPPVAGPQVAGGKVVELRLGQRRHGACSKRQQPAG